MSVQVDAIELAITTPKVDLKGLDHARAKLRALENQLDRLNSKLSGAGGLAGFKMSAPEIQALMKTQSVIPKTMGDLSKMLGRNAQDAEGAWASLLGKYKTGTAAVKRELEGMTKAFKVSDQSIVNQGQAAKFMEWWGKRTVAGLHGKPTVADLFKGASPAPVLPMAAGSAPATGAADAALVDTLKSLNATLAGMATGAAAATTGTGTEKKKKKGYATPTLNSMPGPAGSYLERSDTFSGDGSPLRTRTKSLMRDGRVLTQILDAGGQLSKYIETEALPKSIKDQVETLRASLKKEMAGVSAKREPVRYASMLRQKAGELNGLMDTLFPAGGTKAKDLGMEKFVEQTRARTQKMESDATELVTRETEARQREMARQQDAADKADDRRRAELARARNQSLNQAERKRQADALRAGRLKEQQEKRAVRAQGQMVMGSAQVDIAQQLVATLPGAGFTTGRKTTRGTVDPVTGKGVGRGSETTIYRKEQGKDVTEHRVTFQTINGQRVAAEIGTVQRTLSATRAEAGLLAGDFIRNTAKITTWAASVGVLYRTVELASVSMRSFLESGYQTARLSQVFQGVGGSARELMSDVMHLAAQEGRSATEAQAAAVQWSRLGLNRVQVAEAVRASLVAANVAELSAADATERLAAVYMTYGLSVADLRPLLGQLNSVTNKYNVTNADLLDGLSRSAQAAKQARMPLAELIGVIGAAVGSTGQTGANIGNAVKTVVGKLSNPSLQKELRESFGVEVTRQGGMKDFSTLLSDLYVRYQQLEQVERQAMLVRIAGNTQLNRLAAMLDSYVVAQRLSINAQLDLNSAESENAKIKDTLKSRLVGLSAEWERFVMIQGKGPGRAMAEATTGLKNLLTVANTGAGSTAMTGMSALLTVMALRMTVFAARAKDAANSGGFFMRSLSQIGSVMSGAGVAAASVMSVNSLTGGQQLGNWMGLRADARSRVALRGLDRWGSRQQESAGIQRRYGTGLWQQGYRTPQPFARAEAIGAWGMSAMAATSGTAARGMAVLLGVVRSFGPVLAVIGGAIYGFNKLMEGIGLSADETRSKLSGYNQVASVAQNRASAYEQTARLYDTMSRMLSTARPENQMEALRQMSGLDSDGKIDWQQRAKEQGIPAVVGGFTERAQEMRAQASVERQRQFEAEQAAVAEADRRLKEMKGGLMANTSMGRKERLSLEELKWQGQARMRNIAMEDTADLDAATEASGRYQVMLERRAQGLSAIGSLYERLRGKNPLLDNMAGTAQLEHEIAALERYRDALQKDEGAAADKGAERVRALAGLDKRIAEERTRLSSLSGRANSRMKQGAGGATVVTSAELEDLERQRKDLEGRRGWTQAERDLDKAGRNTQTEIDQRKVKLEAQRQSRENAEKLMRFGLAGDYAGMESGMYRVGRNDTEKLRSEQQFLDKAWEEAASRAESTKSLEDYGRAQAIGLLRMANQTSQLERQVELQRELGQLQHDANREQLRTALGAGPRELAMFIAAQRQAPGMTMPEFMTKSPEMRRMIGMFNPRFSAEGMELGREAQQAGGPNFKGAMTTKAKLTEQMKSVISGVQAAVNGLKIPEGMTQAFEGFTKKVGEAAVQVGRLSLYAQYIADAIAAKVGPPEMQPRGAVPG